MSDLLGLGSQAVSAYRSALSAIGENVANSETKGYARREIRLREAMPISSSSVVYQESLQFGGVRVDGVSRAWDQFRATDARITSAAAGRAETRQTWLSTVEGTLDDGSAGVGAQLGNFFNAGVALAANPDDTLGRRKMLGTLEDVSAAFRTTADALARVSDGLSGTAKLEVDNLNSDLAALAKVNLGLRQAGAGTPTNAALQDERDRLLDSISERVDVNVSFDSKGIATVSMATSGNSVLVDPGGPSLVSLNVAADGRLSLRLQNDGNITALPLAGGRLSGLVDAAAVTADRRADLDSIATNFATAVNTWSAQGRTADGNPGGALIQAPTGAASLRVLTSDPAAIAAQSAPPDSAPNGNLLALNQMRGTDGAESRWAGMVAHHSLMVASANSEATSAATRRDNSFAARDEISGVDLDQEAAELMRYQQAYSGATKIIQVARETMQSILDLF